MQPNYEFVGLNAARVFDGCTMTVYRSVAWGAALLILCLINIFGIRSLNASNFLLSSPDFVEMSKAEVEALAPQFMQAFPNSRFLRTGLTSLAGDWRIIRAEGTHCEEEICPTIILHEGVPWNVLVKAGKEIIVSHNLEQGEFLQLNIPGKGSSYAVITYYAGTRTIYFGQ